MPAVNKRRVQNKQWGNKKPIVTKAIGFEEMIPVLLLLFAPVFQLVFQHI